MKLLLINQSRDRLRRAWLEKWVRGLNRALRKHGYKSIQHKELVVVFVNSGEMRRLNRLYRQKDYATDVLSFEPAEKTSLGELVLCLPVIRGQSRRTGLGETGELGYMLVHGVLHLLGHDHMTRDEESKMFALQDQIYGLLAESVGFR